MRAKPLTFAGCSLKPVFRYGAGAATTAPAPHRSPWGPAPPAAIVSGDFSGWAGGVADRGSGGVGAGMTAEPTQDDVLGYFRTLSNWGRWGDDDQLGTLNLITDDVRRAAARALAPVTSAGRVDVRSPATSWPPPGARVTALIFRSKPAEGAACAGTAEARTARAVPAKAASNRCIRVPPVSTPEVTPQITRARAPREIPDRGLARPLPNRYR